MPQEMRKVNGRWVVTGQQTSADLVPFVKPPKPTAGPGKKKPKDKPKPAQKKLGEQAVLNGRPVVWAGDRYGWQSPGSYQKLTNGLTLLPEFIGSGLQQLGRRLQQKPLQTINRIANPLTGVRVGALGVVGAADNAARVGNALWQRHVERKPVADAAGGAAPVLDRMVDTAYRALGATPPSQMSQRQRDRDMLGRSVTLNLAAGAVPGAGMGVMGATTAVGAAVRGGSAWVLNEVATNYLDDNTQGHLGHLLEGVTGIKTPFNFEPGTKDLIDSANASLIPNALGGLAAGGVLGAAGAGLRNTLRRTRAGRTVERQMQARADLEADGLTQTSEDGRVALVPPEQQTPAAATDPITAYKQAEAEFMDRFGIPRDEPPAASPAPPAADLPTPELPPSPSAAPVRADIPSLPEDAPFAKTQPGELPTADPDIDPFDIEYDPELPEADVVRRQLDELDDKELVQIAYGPEPVVESVNTTLETRPPLELDPTMRVDAVAMPTERLSSLYMDGAGGLEPWSESINALDDNRLRSLASPENSPELYAKVQELSGAEWEQFTRTDILDGIRKLSAEDGKTVIANRLTPQQWAPTSEIDAEPETFQYKSGVNAQGEQVGASLTGATQWDPNSEGVLQVWRAPEDGRLKVVNGHNRRALAERLGVPSLPVQEIVASTPESARAQGAIANINSGAGTPFDAAKFIRDSGIRDEAGLRAANFQINSGFGKQGLALSRLPDDVFQAAVNEQIKLRQAVMIGESGLDEESMRSAYRYVLQKGSDEIRESQLREMLAMARSAPKAAGADQGGLFAGTEWEQTFNEGMLAKAELAASVRAMLGSEKKLFGTVGRQAGQISRVGSVDQGAAKEISGEAARALNIFDQVKYEDGPVSDLLNEGAARVVAGEKASAVAQQIKNRLAASIKEAMGKDPAGAVEDVIQQDMLPAVDTPMTPPKLTAAERREIKKAAMQRAIADGEVRPPATPMPQLPEPAQVRLSEVQLPAPTPRKEIPAAAGRKLSPSQVQSKAEMLMQWANSGRSEKEWLIRSIDDAVRLVQAKGLSLDVEKIPGINLDAALSARAMGRTGPDVEAVAAAYRQFYGVPDPVIAPGSKAAQALADEFRLAAEHAKDDAATTWIQEEGLRDAYGYEERTFDQKKDLGLAEGWDPAEEEAVFKELEDLAGWLGDQGRKNAGLAKQGYEQLAGIEDISGGQLPTDRVAPGPRLGQGATPGQPPISEMPKISDILGQTMRAMAESDARLYRGLGESLGNIRAKLNELDDAPASGAKIRLTPNQRAEIENFNTTLIREMGIDLDGAMTKDQLEALERNIRTDFAPPEQGGVETVNGVTRRSMIGLADRMRKAIDAINDRPATAAPLPGPVRPKPMRLAPGAAQPEFALPADLSKAAPRYGRATIQFESDLDRAAYTLANDATKASKAGPKFKAAVEAAGLDYAQVVAHGKQVKAAIKQAAGGGAASKASGEIVLPAQPWAGDAGDALTSEVPSRKFVPGWDEIDTAPIETTLAMRERRRKRLTEIIRQVAGDEAVIGYQDAYTTKVRSDEWGGNGKEMSQIAGFYRFQHDLVQINGMIMSDDLRLDQVAFHESFHRLQFIALNKKEASVMDTAWARFKVAMGGDIGTGKAIAYAESQAIAFQRYAAAKRQGQDPIRALLGGYEPGLGPVRKAVDTIAASFDRVLDVIEKLYNLYKNGTFDSVRAIYERARRGDLRDAEEFGALKFMGKTGQWRTQDWSRQPLRKAGETRVRQQIESIDQRINEVRTKATEEGC